MKSIKSEHIQIDILNCFDNQLNAKLKKYVFNLEMTFKFPCFSKLCCILPRVRFCNDFHLRAIKMEILFWKNYSHASNHVIQKGDNYKLYYMNKN